LRELIDAALGRDTLGAQRSSFILESGAPGLELGLLCCGDGARASPSGYTELI
jgi:hypothetical protein